MDDLMAISPWIQAVNSSAGRSFRRRGDCDDP
jgi:hypothetical protein